MFWNRCKSFYTDIFFCRFFFYRKFVVLNTKYKFKKHKNWLYIVVAHLHCCCTVIKRLHCARSPTRHDKLAVCRPSGQIKKPVEDDEFSRLLNAIIQETWKNTRLAGKTHHILMNRWRSVKKKKISKINIQVTWIIYLVFTSGAPGKP